MATGSDMSITDSSSYLQVNGSNVCENDDLWTLRKRIEKLNNELKKVKSEVEFFREEEDKLKKKTRQQLTEKENETTALRYALGQKEKDNEKMKRKLNAYSGELVAKDIALEENHNRIETLEKKLEELEAELANVKRNKRIPSADRNYQEQQKELRLTRKELETLKAKEKELYEKLHAKDVQIAAIVGETHEKVSKLEGKLDGLASELKEQLNEVLGLMRPKVEPRDTQQTKQEDQKSKREPWKYGKPKYCRR
ncbi:uncharacterized protein LOC127868929 [Dreissena polymorpha]|uniref:Uncharacterized protein n=1 Tax=Dreissena polymorpha TaxID=45954 RepID=A0A9D4M942_DREPO|nr:uncharacterized protein LOC127868929 [Dreissena polymorpha]KAH3873035.1 hypothetical protein DPMN_036260 [Dreissena polymorpha]